MKSSARPTCGRGGVCAALSIALSAQLVGCGRTLPAPAAPPAGNPPSVELPDPQSGETVIVLDANEPSRASVVLARTTAVGYSSRGTSVIVHGTQIRQLCARTPCAVSLPQGEIELAFESLQTQEAKSTDTLDVKKKPLVFRHALGEVSTHPVPYLGGWTLAISGLTLGGLGYLLAGRTSYDGTESKFLGMNQTTSLAVGGALTVAGIALAYLFQPSRRPGSSTTFELASTAH